MMPDKVSPEEKLFNIIQGGKNRPPRPKATQGAKKAPIVTGAIALPLNLHEVDLQTINKALAGVLFVVTAFAIYYLIAKKPSVAEITEEVSKIPVQIAEREPIETFKPISFYLEMTRERNILQPAPEEKAEEITVEEEEPEPELPELASNLKLQGISWGKVPKAIVRDEADEQIYFLKEGQMIGITKIRIKSIAKDKVIISYGEEEMELL